jgi:hypothetical protein
VKYDYMALIVIASRKFRQFRTVLIIGAIDMLCLGSPFGLHAPWPGDIAMTDD